MRKLTIKYQIIILISTLLIFQVLIGAIGINEVNNVNNKLTSVFKVRLPSIDNLVQADRDFQQSLVAERTLLLSQLSEEQKKIQAKDYFKNAAQVEERFNVYKELATTKEEQSLISEFEKELTNWKKKSNSLLNFDKKGNLSNINKEDAMKNSLLKVSKNFEASREQLDKLQELILSFGEKEYIEAQELSKKALYMISIFVIMSAVISTIFGFFLIRMVTNNIKNTLSSLNEKKNSLNNISRDLLEKSSSLASASQEQSSGVTETSSSLHEISQMVENNSNNAEKSSNLIDSSTQLVSKGVKVIENLTESINQVNAGADKLMDAVDENNTDLESIIQTFEEIKSKTQVINDIVFQTKLLSFNASVEAARAGEHGKGFSVVAEEVGNLAQMSGNSADQISKLLEDSANNVNKLIKKSKQSLEERVKSNKELIRKSVSYSEESIKYLKSLASQFKEIETSASNVVNASKEQQIGVVEINKAMQEISNSISLTSSDASKIENTSVNLNKIVKEINTNIKNLEKLIKNKKREVNDLPR